MHSVSPDESSQLQFDHCYQKIVEESEILRMEALGFTLHSRSAEHPYSLLSRFIMIGPPTNPGPTQQRYIEFCWIRDLAGELSHNKQVNPHASDRDIYAPGFSLRGATPLDEYLEAKAGEWKALQPSLTHRNYDWRENESERRAGWNFLNFEIPPVAGVEIWLTEYEERPAADEAEAKRRLQPILAVHANGVNAFSGFVFNLSDEHERVLSMLTGSAWRNGTLTMTDGLEIHSQRKHPQFRELLAHKASAFTAVLLGCQSLERFCEVSGLQPIDGHAMVRIASSQPESWDILVAEAGPR